MSIMPRFAEPWALVLLLAIPWSIYLGLGIQSLSRFRKFMAIGLRTVLLTALVLALAGTEIVQTRDRLAVFFLLDQSDSIPDELRQAAAQSVRNYADAYMNPPRDEAGVIVFGEDASIELGISASLGLREVRSVVGGEQTDLAAAMRLAMAAFPQGYMRRIVVLTDGNETQGAALEEVKAARAGGVAVDVVPITLGGSQEVRMREVSLPSQTSADEPFQLRVVVESEQAAPATLRLYRRSHGRRRMLPPQEVQLQKGDNVFLLTQELSGPGFYEYEVAIDSEADTVLRNNTARGFTTVAGEPRVLYVEGDIANSSFLLPALLAEGIETVRIGPASMPSSLAQFQAFDGIILSDVAATELSAGQMDLVEAAVRDLGVGLIMIGGPESFGAGAYLDTPVERALPVDMDIKQRKVLPRGALAVVLHTCEIPEGNMWAREIALAALNTLSPRDLMGALGYMWDSGDRWIYELAEVGDRSTMRQAIVQAASQIGDMPATDPTLALAYRGLRNADAAAKRVVLISDGDPAPPLRSTIAAYQSSKIAISTVCIAPHSPNDQGMLRQVAQSTGGEYYFVNNPRNLPQIFSKEAAVVKRGMFFEKEFMPEIHHDSELLTALRDGSPPLHGYVVTTAKDNATIPLVSQEGDPVLAHWRYGLGKSLAFTSDVTSRWAPRWVAWEGFTRFWTQAVRWTLRELSPSVFKVETSREDGRGKVRIDAMDEQGKFVNFLRPQGIVTTPDFERLELDLLQTGPGIYEADFPADDSGVYMVNLTYETESGQAGMIPAGLAVDYSREYEYYTTNLQLLQRMAEEGAGRFLEPSDNPFTHDLKASANISPVWHWLALLAACLLPLEVFYRRVMIPWDVIRVGALRALRRLPLLKRWIPQPGEARTAATGHYGAGAPAASRDFGEAGGTVPVSFGEVGAPAAGPTPGQIATPGAPPAEPGKPAASSAYTQRLLDAKKRALKDKQRSEKDENE